MKGSGLDGMGGHMKGSGLDGMGGLVTDTTKGTALFGKREHCSVTTTLLITVCATGEAFLTDHSLPPTPSH